MFSTKESAFFFALIVISSGGGSLAMAANECDINSAGPIDIPAHKSSDTPKRAYRLSDGSVVFLGMFSVDADGAPNAYNPDNVGLDDITNAGSPGNWYGLATNAPSCGPAGALVIQGANDPAPGFYVSTTSMTNPSVHDCRNQRNYVDSTSIPYVALPRSIAKLENNQGNLVALKPLSAVSTEFAVHAEAAPSDGLGEGSIALAKRLGLKSDPRRGGTSKREIVFIILTERMGFPANAEEVQTKARVAFESWGGDDRLAACGRALQSPSE